MAENSSEYVMGHDDRERRRLSLQASIINPLTQQLLERAGISAGMRVLDIGCGVGEVSIIAARLVGRSGRVTGIDIDEGALAIATARAKEESLPQIELVHGSVSTFRPEGLFDAVIGRHILIHMPDPGAVIRLAHSLLRAGGVAAFHEYDFSVVHRPFPPAPVYERVFEIFREFFGKTHGNIGTRLFHLFSDAGFASPQCVVASPMDGGADSPFYDWIAESLRSVLPRAAAAGIARAEEVAAIDSLVTRLREEAVSQRGCVIAPAMIGCFGRKR